MTDEILEVGDTVEYIGAIGYENPIDQCEILQIFKDLSNDDGLFYIVSGFGSCAIPLNKLKLIKKCTTKHAVSVIDLARDAYWSELRRHAQSKNLSLKNLSFHDLEQIFTKLVIPTIAVVRKADREQNQLSWKDQDED